MLGVKRNEVRGSETNQTLGGSNYKQLFPYQPKILEEKVCQVKDLEEKLKNLDSRHSACGGRSLPGSCSMTLIHENKVEKMKQSMIQCAFGFIICLFCCDHVISIYCST